MKNYFSRELYVDGKYIRNPDYIRGCENTRLIQRLRMPRGTKDISHSFGGGLRHGGLSDKAWELISSLCSFDYMGAAEFEFGALPKAFQKMVDCIEGFEAYTLTVSGNPEFPFSGKFQEYKYNAREKIRKKHTLEATVFVLAPRNIRPHVEEVIRSLVRDEEDFLKEHSRLCQTLFTSPQWVQKEGEDDDSWLWCISQGWLEFDNGFMFFANEEMWRGFGELFGVAVPGVTEINPVRPDYSLVNKALESCPRDERVTS